ncbi:restriction endonuclease subunit S [Streptococcus sp. NLN64]|uniref:restriction endonuclease subunit S n=1 Tax=Streptococcus sp. NLN64 TaxID=2822799 RepID=UPI001FFD0281|nr:restriction endonuclease subunit S [Streptococcus sp. NLN64]
MQRNVPEFRFEGFDNCWEKRRLKEISSHRGGTAIEKYFDQDGTYKVISIGSYGLDNKYVDQNIRALSNAVTDSRVVYAGELTMVLNDKTANGSIIGRTLFIEEDKQFVVNQRTEIITPGKRFNALFAYFTLNNDFRERVKKIVQGGTQVYVNYSAVENLKLSIPSFDEQEQIGIFLRKLDHLITLQQRELDYLKETKKTMLSKLFPKKSETIPGVRFDGFTNVWEQRKLGDLGKIVTGNTPSTTENINYEVGGLMWVTPSDISHNKIYSTSKQLSEIGISKSRTVPSGSILVTCIASIGKNALTLSKVAFNQQINALTPTENYDSYFLLTSSYYWSQFMIQTLAASGTMQIVNKTEFGKILTKVPSLKEQQSIGSFFSTLDHLITLQQRKVDLLKSQKQTLLKSMFPR